MTTSILMNNLMKILAQRESGPEEEETSGAQETEENETSQGGSNEEPNVMVLGPDHPKMARFQAALTEHLKKQIYAADLELCNLENDLKMKK